SHGGRSPRSAAPFVWRVPCASRCGKKCVQTRRDRIVKKRFPCGGGSAVWTSAMRWRNIGAMNCSVARTLELIGDRWTLLIVHEAFLGVHRFEQFNERLGVARNILTVRLQALVRHGILDRVLYQERPARYEYRLTDRGHDLHGVICLLREWG